MPWREGQGVGSRMECKITPSAWCLTHGYIWRYYIMYIITHLPVYTRTWITWSPVHLKGLFRPQHSCMTIVFWLHSHKTHTRVHMYTIYLLRVIKSEFYYNNNYYRTQVPWVSHPDSLVVGRQRWWLLAHYECCWSLWPVCRCRWLSWRWDRPLHGNDEPVCTPPSLKSQLLWGSDTHTHTHTHTR